jgi:hypothetical protein
MLADRRLESIEWGEALNWWPHRPLLRSANPPISSFIEDVLAASYEGGTNGDPKRDWTALSLLYRNREHSPESLSLSQLMDVGTVQVRVAFYPPGSEVPWRGSEVGTKTVRVRGHIARMVVIRRSDGSNVDWRAIRWEEQEESGIVQWEVSNSPEAYSDEDSIEFINDLDQIQ